MLKNAKEFFTTGAPLEIDAAGTPTSRDIHIGVLALLSDMALTDSTMESGELEMIVSSMERCCEISPSEVGELIEITSFLKRDGKRAGEFVKVLNEKLTVRQKQEILIVLWKVIMADGSASKDEAGLAAELRKKLNLSMEQAAWARAMSERGPGEPDRQIPE